MSGVRASVLLPTRDGAATLPTLLGAVARAAARVPLEIVAIDSDSRDGTVDLLRAAGARVLDLGGQTFGHGSARNRAAAAATGEILVLLTQDVEPVGDDWLAPLLAAFDDPAVAGAFGRQVPRDASPEEAFLCAVNYGPAPRAITLADAQRFGPGRTLFSSAFGAMRRADWARYPLPDVVMSEDQGWAVAVLRAGRAIRYVPDAAAWHGHRFTLARAFRRNFDSGSSLAALDLGGAAWGPGLRHLGRELRWLAQRYGAAAAAHGVVYEVVRMAGYQCGRHERRLPRAVARRLGEAPRP